MIQIEKMSKVYRGAAYEVQALKGVSLHIEQGEFIAIMGESGSGKSTLLNCIGLMDDFDEGSYRLDGLEIGTLSKRECSGLRKDKISFVFQHFELMRNYTTYENIEIPLLAKNVKKSERKQRIREAAKRLGVEELLKKYPYQMSGGQQQRIAIARAMVSENPVILADEPTGALDSGNSMELMKIMLDIRKLGRTIVMVTHDQKVAEYSDRIIYLRDGEIAES